MIPNYQWTRTLVVQQLGTAEAYVHASFGIRPERMSDSPLQMDVRHLRYAARRISASLCRTYIVLLDVRKGRIAEEIMYAGA